jgi:hypothetical protein
MVLMIVALAFAVALTRQPGSAQPGGAGPSNDTNRALYTRLYAIRGERIFTIGLGGGVSDGILATLVNVTDDGLELGFSVDPNNGSRMTDLMIVKFSDIRTLEHLSGQAPHWRLRGQH